MNQKGEQKSGKGLGERRRIKEETEGKIGGETTVVEEQGRKNVEG
jgi:hypothetical protein